MERPSVNISLSSDNICDVLMTAPACKLHPQPLTCMDFWMNSNLSGLFESLCSNDDSYSENCILSLLESNATALIDQCQMEVSSFKFFLIFF